MHNTETTVDALVIGAGPAGLMAAQALSEAGRKVLIVEAMPAPARKFLMAGKSGLNLSKEEGFDQFVSQYAEAIDFLRPMLSAFGPQQIQDWATSLDQPVFTGSSGRIFPVTMKASPLLRAWLAKLQNNGVELRKKWRWQGFADNSMLFDTPDGPHTLRPAVTVLALGGASWSRLGSDGHWAQHLAQQCVALSPFAAANAGLRVAWSEHMRTHFGTPIKNTRLSAGSSSSCGEFVITAGGLEGSGIYSMSKAVREGHALHVDLYPDHTHQALQQKFKRPQGKNSLSNHLRKTIGLKGAKLAMLREFSQPLPEGDALIERLKDLPIAHRGPGDIDKAISTSGGVRLGAVDENLMLKDKPGVYCVGEMLDWEAPTGGYLLTACLATGYWAGKAAAGYKQPSDI